MPPRKRGDGIPVDVELSGGNTGMPMFAIVGCREMEKVPEEGVSQLRDLLQALAIDKWDLCVGASPGIEQRAAFSWLKRGGHARLYLPWWSYEQSWVKQIKDAYIDNLVIQAYDEGLTAWADSVPSSQKKRVAYLARFYGVVSGCEFVVALPGGDSDVHHALKVAAEEGTKTFDISTKQGRDRLRKEILEW